MNEIRFVEYRIRNVSGVVTSHSVGFRGGVRVGWGQTETLEDFLGELSRSPWVHDVKVDGEVAAA